MRRPWKSSVSAGINISKYDLRVALRAGINRFAHAPNYGYGNGGAINASYPQLSRETMNLLDKNPGTVINPTLYRTMLNIRYLPEDQRPNQTGLKLLREFHRKLLEDLAGSKVSIV
jgi:hypothetical protein